MNVQEAMVARYLQDMGASQAAAAAAASAVVKKRNAEPSASAAAAARAPAPQPLVPGSTAATSSSDDEQAKILHLMQLLAAAGALPDVQTNRGTFPSPQDSLAGASPFNSSAGMFGAMLAASGANQPAQQQQRLSYESMSSTSSPLYQSGGGGGGGYAGGWVAAPGAGAGQFPRSSLDSHLSYQSHLSASPAPGIAQAAAHELYSASIDALASAPSAMLPASAALHRKVYRTPSAPYPGPSAPYPGQSAQTQGFRTRSLDAGAQYQQQLQQQQAMFGDRAGCSLRSGSLDLAHEDVPALLQQQRQQQQWEYVRRQWGAAAAQPPSALSPPPGLVPAAHPHPSQPQATAPQAAVLPAASRPATTQVDWTQSSFFS